MSDNLAEYKFSRTYPKAGAAPTGDGWMQADSIDNLRKEQHIANLLKVIELSSRDDVPDAVYASTDAAVAKLQALGVLA